MLIFCAVFLNWPNELELLKTVTLQYMCFYLLAGSLSKLGFYVSYRNILHIPRVHAVLVTVGAVWDGTYVKTTH